jgi:hypothetical protein
LTIASEPGSSVSVSNGTTLLGLATETATKGVFEFTTNVESADRFSFTTSAKDVAGNTSDGNTQTAIYVSGEALETTKAGSLDLRVVNSTPTVLTLGLYPKFTNTGIGSADVSLSIDTSKVLLTDTVTTQAPLSVFAFTNNPDQTTFDSLVFNSLTSDLAFKPTPIASSTALFVFDLNWKSVPQEIDIVVNALEIAPPEGAFYSDLVMPSFSFKPGSGIAQGTSGDDLIITGSGNVIVTTGTGKDTVMLESLDVNLTITDFSFGTDQIDISSLLGGAGYTSIGSSAAANVGQILSTVPDGIAALIAAKDASLDNKFAALFEPDTTGVNKGTLRLFGDTDPAMGTGHIAPAQIDIVLGANSSGSFSLSDLVFNQINLAVL